MTTMQTVLKAIAEPRRLRILEILRDEGSLSVSAITERVDVTQQAVSLHLKVLEEAGLVAARREGTRHLYAVKPAGFQPVQEFLTDFWPGQLATLKSTIERR